MHMHYMPKVHLCPSFKTTMWKQSQKSSSNITFIPQNKMMLLADTLKFTYHM